MAKNGKQCNVHHQENGQFVISLYNETLYKNQQSMNWFILVLYDSYNTDKSQIHYVEWKKPDTKVYICWSHLHEIQNYSMVIKVMIVIIGV